VNIQRLDKQTLKSFYAKYLGYRIDSPKKRHVNRNADWQMIDICSRNNSVDLRKADDCNAFNVGLDLRKINGDSNKCNAPVQKDEVKSSAKRQRCSNVPQNQNYCNIISQAVDCIVSLSKLEPPDADQFENLDIDSRTQRKRHKRDSAPVLVLDDDDEKEIIDAPTIESFHPVREMDCTDFGWPAASKSKSMANDKSDHKKRRRRKRHEKMDSSFISPLVIEPENIHFNTLEMSASEINFQDVESKRIEEVLHVDGEMIVIVNELDSE